VYQAVLAAELGQLALLRCNAFEESVSLSDQLLESAGLREDHNFDFSIGLLMVSLRTTSWRYSVQQSNVVHGFHSPAS
jgi:hypothetical protein